MRQNRQTNFPSDFKIRSAEDGKKTIEGYFVRFNEETHIWNDMYEEIAPSAVQRSLKENDIRVLFDHDASIVLGRSGNNTAIFKADDVGLWGCVEINPKDQQANDIHARIERGDIEGASFGFIPLDEQACYEGGKRKVIVRDADIFEVSIVTFPAYPQTQITAREKIFNVDTVLEKRRKLIKKKIKGEYEC